MKTFTNKKRLRKRQLTVQYMGLIALLFLISLSSVLVLEHILQKEEGYSAVINLSGRQRMLSQKLQLLAFEIVDGNSRGNATEKLVKKLVAAANLMEHSHQLLLAGKAENDVGVALSRTLSKMYFKPPFEVDRLVTEYLAGIRALIAMPTRKRGHADLESLSILGRDDLLHSLNAVVLQYEMESRKSADLLKGSGFVAFLSMLFLILLSIVFMFRPMTEILVENESMLNNILDSTPILMDIIDKDGVILYQSNFLIKMLGSPTLGQKCFIAYKRGKAESDYCRSCLDGEYPGTKITSCFDRLGLGAIVEISHLSVLFEGNEACLRTFVDITEQKKTEELLVRAREEANRISELKSNFLANMSHEIRTPMSAIIGFSELVLETDLSEQQQDYLGKIKRSSLILLGIINDILDFSKIEAGKLTLEKRRFSLSNVMEDIVTLFSNEVQEKNIGLLVDQQADIPALLVGDSLRLHQILVNLVGNSLKFTNQGKIIIQISLEDLDGQRARIKFIVTDTGIGISSDKLATLFDSFSQADTSITRKYGGTGLGLAISRQLVELLGGELKVVSKEGEGTTFNFVLEFAMAIGGDYLSRVQQRSFALSGEKAIGIIKGAHLLLVEDNAINCQLAEEMLAKANITLDIVVNGQQALKKFAEADYDAILMDIQMPVLGGIECTRELRQEEQRRSHTGYDCNFAQIPIIAMTANAMLGDRDRYLATGMNDYIAKPVNRAELFNVLSRWIPEDRTRRRVRKVVSVGSNYSQVRKGVVEDRRKSSVDRRRIGQVFALPDNLVGIDLNQGLSSVEGDVGFYLRLLKEFAVEHALADREIRVDLVNNARERAGRLVHTIKGLAGNLGARDLAAAALALEQAIMAENEHNEQLIQFESALKLVLRSLDTIVEGQHSSKMKNTTVKHPDNDRIADLIAELHVMLSGKNFRADSKLQELIPLLVGQDIWLIERLERSLNKFDFDTAKILLAELEKNIAE